MKDNTFRLTKSSEKALDELMAHVLEGVKPSKKEIEESKFTINEVMGRLMKHTPKDVEILLAGSVARGTQIKGNSDIDIFLLFPRKMKDTVIEKMGLEIARKIVDKKKGESYMVKYAEHPYTKLLLNNRSMNVDIVPAYKIEHANERGTAVDRTQLHNEFVNSKLSVRQRDDVRILKAFLKGHNIYGAEAKTEGFSGYLCELLVHNYGSFKKVVSGVANLDLPLVVNFAKHDTEKNDSKSLVAHFGKKFIVIDPTDSNRNVAANVSDESLLRFVVASRNLISSPSNDAFYGAGRSDVYSERKLLEINRMLGVELYVLHFDVPDIAADIIWQQLKKTRLRLHDVLKENGFEPIISLQNYEDKNAVIGLFMNDIKFATRKVIGPPLSKGDAIGQFMKAHKNSMLMSVEDGRVVAIEKARYPDAQALIRNFIKSKNTKLPSNLDQKKASIYINKMPEKYAKLIYAAYVNKFSI